MTRYNTIIRNKQRYGLFTKIKRTTDNIILLSIVIILRKIRNRTGIQHIIFCRLRRILIYT